MVYVLLTKDYETVGIFESEEAAKEYCTDPILADLLIAKCTDLTPVTPELFPVKRADPAIT